MPRVNKDALAREQTNELKTIFANNRRFKLVKLVAHGYFGTAFHFLLNDPRFPRIRNFIIKRAFNTEAAIGELRKEKKILKVCNLDGRVHE